MHYIVFPNLFHTFIHLNSKNIYSVCLFVCVFYVIMPVLYELLIKCHVCITPKYFGLQNSIAMCFIIFFLNFFSVCIYYVLIKFIISLYYSLTKCVFSEKQKICTIVLNKIYITHPLGNAKKI